MIPLDGPLVPLIKDPFDLIFEQCIPRPPPRLLILETSAHVFVMPSIESSVPKRKQLANWLLIFPELNKVGDA